METVNVPLAMECGHERNIDGRARDAVLKPPPPPRRTAGMELLIERLRSIHERATSNPPLQRLHLVSRLLLAMAFLPTGMVKVLGQRFTSLPIDNPVGFFFEAMYQSGWYWNFIGWGQVVGAVLLLIPRTSFLGALVFLPILVNVTAITWSIGFQGTVYITSLMLVANLFLLAWEGDRIEQAARAILSPRPSVPGMPGMEAMGWAIGSAGGFILLFGTRFLTPQWSIPVTLACVLTGSVFLGTSWIRAWRRKPRRREQGAAPSQERVRVMDRAALRTRS